MALKKLSIDKVKLNDMSLSSRVYTTLSFSSSVGVKQFRYDTPPIVSAACRKSATKDIATLSLFFSSIPCKNMAA